MECKITPTNNAWHCWIFTPSRADSFVLILLNVGKSSILRAFSLQKIYSSWLLMHLPEAIGIRLPTSTVPLTIEHDFFLWGVLVYGIISLIVSSLWTLSLLSNQPSTAPFLIFCTILRIDYCYPVLILITVLFFFLTFRVLIEVFNIWFSWIHFPIYSICFLLLEVCSLVVDWRIHWVWAAFSCCCYSIVWHDLRAKGS